jgi:hypothetical protein
LNPIDWENCDREKSNSYKIPAYYVIIKFNLDESEPNRSLAKTLRLTQQIIFASFAALRENFLS